MFHDWEAGHAHVVARPSTPQNPHNARYRLYLFYELGYGELDKDMKSNPFKQLHVLIHMNIDDGSSVFICPLHGEHYFHYISFCSQQMLLGVLDEHCVSCNDPRNNLGWMVSTYDFVYTLASLYL